MDKVHIYALHKHDIDTVIAFMAKRQKEMSVKEKKVLIHLTDLRYNSRGTEMTG